MTISANNTSLKQDTIEYCLQSVFMAYIAEKPTATDQNRKTDFCSQNYKNSCKKNNRKDTDEHPQLFTPSLIVKKKKIKLSKLTILLVCPPVKG